MDKKFIINLQGNEFVKHEGLLNEFHKNGGSEIRTEILHTDPFIIKATASGERGVYQGIGDADDNNVNRNILPHKIRMAETRAINRALRLYNNIGMCSAEELGGEEQKITKRSSNAKNILWKKIQEVAGKDPEEDLILDTIAVHSGVELKSKDEITEDKAKSILDLWT